MEKKIHQIWFQGVDKIPNKYRKYQKSVINTNPSWKYNLYSEKNLLDYAKRYSNTCYKKMINYQYMHQKIDLGRYLISYFEGGITVDMDVECIKPYDELFIKYPNILDYEVILSTLNNDIYKGLFAKLYLSIHGIKPDEFINNSFIFTPNPLSIIIKNLIDKIIKNKDCNYYDSSITCINKTTGPQTFTKYMNMNKNNILVIPIEFVSLDEDENKNKDIFTIHHIQHTWIHPIINLIFKIYILHNNLYLIDTLLILFSLLIMYNIIFYIINKTKT